MTVPWHKLRLQAVMINHNTPHRWGGVSMFRSQGMFDSDQDGGFSATELIPARIVVNEPKEFGQMWARAHIMQG